MAEGTKTTFYYLKYFAIFLLTSFNLSAQEKSDYGFFAGTSYYMGDLNSSVHYAMPSFAVGPIFRYNFNMHNSIRAHAFYHGLSGSDPDYEGYIPPGLAPDFNAKFVDLGLDFEFNWKSYRTANRKTVASPYVFAGLGYGLEVPAGGVLSVQSRSHITMPFGLGYKVNVGRWLSAGFEASARKVFSDEVDGVTNYPDGALDDIIAPFGNNDWYFFTGVFVTYKIFKFWEECHAYD